MAPVVHVDKKFNISLKNVKDTLKIQPDDTFFIQQENAHTITLKKTTDNDPFIETVKNPAHIRNKKKFDLARLEDELWST
ncbi:MAG: hypothetical protein NTV68_04610 [Methanomicrobiales archaeon]|nr:hypothetical protein [Methanomicrobiales archaeon]